MKLMKSPRIHPLSFGHKFGSRYGPIINRDFLLGYDPFDEHPLVYTKRPFVNIRKNAQYYKMEIPLPGYKQEQISVHLENDVLTIKGQKEKEVEGKSRFILKEYDLHSFERSFQLSPATDKNSIKATFKDGLLSLTLKHLKKASAVTKPKNIPVSID